MYAYILELYQCYLLVFTVLGNQIQKLIQVENILPLGNIPSPNFLGGGGGVDRKEGGKEREKESSYVAWEQSFELEVILLS